jgi:hypothetical protein
MSAGSDSNGRPSNSDAAEGVLANLPRTRPQRSSARRAAARRETAAAQPPAAGEPARPVARSGAKSRSAASARRAPASPTRRKAAAKSASPAARKKAKGAARPAKPAAKSARPAPRRRPAVSAVEDQVPRQGFESELDRASGPVQPPGGAELVASAAEIIGELAKAGLSRSERLLRDALARLPLS